MVTVILLYSSLSLSVGNRGTESYEVCGSRNAYVLAEDLASLYAKCSSLCERSASDFAAGWTVAAGLVFNL